MRDKEILDLVNAYKQICEQKIIKKHDGSEVVESKKTILQHDHEEVDVYDEVLEYLLGEGYSEEESKQIMVNLIDEGLGKLVQSGLKAASTRIGIGQKAGQILKNVLKAGATDTAAASIAAGGVPSAKLTTTAAKAAATNPAPIVRTVRSSAIRNAPTVRTPSPDPWNQVSTTGNRAQEISRSARPSTAKPSPQRSLPGSPTPRALSGSQTRAALPSGTRGGSLVKATPSGSITPASKSGSLARTTPRSSSITPAAKPITGKPSNTRIEPVNVRDVTASTRSLSGASNNPALPSGRSQQFRDVQKLTQSTGGGPLGTRELPKLSPRAPKPAWGSGTNLRATTKPSVTSRSTTPETPKNIPPATSTRTSRPASRMPSGTPPTPRGIGGLGRLAAGAALGGVAADMAFPEPTAPGTRDKAPKLPTSAKEVKRGETYFDYGTRIGSSQRPAARKKVGPKIVGSGKVGTPAQDFDRTYGAAKAKGGMGSTFTWKGNLYKVY